MHTCIRAYVHALHSLGVSWTFQSFNLSIAMLGCWVCKVHFLVAVLVSVIRGAISESEGSIRVHSLQDLRLLVAVCRFVGYIHT